MRTIADYYIEPNGVPDYFAMVDLALINDNDPFKAALSQGAFKTEINGVTYVRVGMYQKNQGTQLTLEQFQDYFDAYGQIMLTKAEYDALVAENQPQEVE